MSFFFSCVSSETEQSTLEDSEDIEVPNDFKEFYQRFHEDSIFQMSHIQFPLPKKVYDLDSTSLTLKWTADVWDLHSSANLNSSEFSHVINILSDRLIIETHKHRQFPMLIERRWAKMNGEWRLIYYTSTTLEL